MSLSMVEAAQHVLWGNVADMNGASVLQEHSAWHTLVTVVGKVKETVSGEFLQSYFSVCSDCSECGSGKYVAELLMHSVAFPPLHPPPRVFAAPVLIDLHPNK